MAMNTINRLMIVAIFAIIPVFLKAQEDARIVEKHTDPFETVTRFSETPYARLTYARAADPVIAAMVSAINADTLRATLQDLQNWGSRFLMNDNKKEIAMSLVNKFLSYGYTDVKLDSFYLVIQNWSGLSDSSWQYNVVCTLPGSSAPEEIYVVGGHWDSICLPDPFNDAPGVDDNGTAVAATLEIARVMKEFNYKPEATIQFTLFAAEELGLFGSRVATTHAQSDGVDIRYMLNLDMISNNPDNLPQVKIYQYLGFEWAGFAAAEATERYTDLSVVIPDNKTASGSDSYSYWLQQYPSAYFEEIIFSPNWHHPSDTLGNCNVPYLKKVTGGALATLAEQQILPYPQKLRANSTREEITLQWMPTKNVFVKGFNIYRSDSSGSGYQKLTPAPVADSMYHDLSAIPNKQYYYAVTTVNDSLVESAYSNEVQGARFQFSDSMLVLASLRGNTTTPDSVLAFYQAVLDTIPYKWFDINDNQKINMAMVSRYRSIFWITNSTNFNPITDEMSECVSEYIDNGGNLLFAGFSPGKLWGSSNMVVPAKIPETSIFREVFKVDSLDRKIQSLLFRANAVAPGYDTLHIDSLKYMEKNFKGQIYNIDLCSPAPEANTIYRFDSHFDSTSSLGKAKHRPVGLEYMGTDHKSILLSFPLYYLDTTDAREFLHYVVTKKFTYPEGIQRTAAVQPFALHVYPNPIKDVCHVTFKLVTPGHVRLQLVSLMGKPVATWVDRNLEQGSYSFSFPISSLLPGLYEVVLQEGSGMAVQRIIRVE
jgi:hypothetical protein